MFKNANKKLLVISILVTFILGTAGLPRSKFDARKFAKDIPVFSKHVKSINTVTASNSGLQSIEIPEGYDKFHFYIGKKLENLSLKHKAAKEFSSKAGSLVTAKGSEEVKYISLKRNKKGSIFPAFILSKSGVLGLQVDEKTNPQYLAEFGPAYFDDPSLFSKFVRTHKGIISVEKNLNVLLINLYKIRGLELEAKNWNIVFLKEGVVDGEKRIYVHPIATEIEIREGSSSMETEHRLAASSSSSKSSSSLSSTKIGSIASSSAISKVSSSTANSSTSTSSVRSSTSSYSYRSSSSSVSSARSYSSYKSSSSSVSLSSMSSSSSCETCTTQKQEKTNRWFKKYVSGWSSKVGGFLDGDADECGSPARDSKLQAIQNILDEVQSNANGYDADQIKKEKAAGNWLNINSLCSNSCSNPSDSCQPSGIKLNSGGPWNLDLAPKGDTLTDPNNWEYKLGLKDQDSGSFGSSWTDEQTLTMQASSCICCPKANP